MARPAQLDSESHVQQIVKRWVRLTEMEFGSSNLKQTQANTFQMLQTTILTGKSSKSTLTRELTKWKKYSPATRSKQDLV